LPNYADSQREPEVFKYELNAYEITTTSTAVITIVKSKVKVK